MRHLLLVTTLSVAPGLLSAQTETTATQAAETITAEGIARHVGVIADDSMMGRDTPSRGLTKTAQYIADQFKELGLQPGGDASGEVDSTDRPINPSWFQRYPIPGNLTLNYAASQISFSAKMQHDTKQIVNEIGQPIEKATAVTFTNGARFAVDTVPQSGARGDWEGIAPPRVFVVSGRQTPATLKKADVRDKVVLYIPAPGVDSAMQRRLIDQLYTWNHVLILSGEDSASFAQRQRAATEHPVFVVDRPLENALGARHWATYVWPGAVNDFLESAGWDLAQARTDTTPQVRELPSLKISLEPQLDGWLKDTATAMNVVGILPGTNPKFSRKNNPKWSWDEYLVISAHMDHTGISRGKADSINNGANDNASGVAALLELAKAFSQPGARPRRSIIFLATSGGSKEFWGSTYWAGANAEELVVAANINLDMIGRKAGDSVLVDGMGDLNLPARPDWIAAQHPELKLTVVDGGSISSPQSDHFAFVRRAIPSLYFYNDTHTEPVFGPDSPAAIDAELEARIVKLVFHLTYELGNNDRKATWTAAGRRNRVRVLGQ